MTPWAELASYDRMAAVLRAVAELDAEDHEATAGAVALRVSRWHPMELAGWGKTGRGNGLRRMSTATRVTPAITRLRDRGLLAMAGYGDVTTRAGEEWLAAYAAGQRPPLPDPVRRQASYRTGGAKRQEARVSDEETLDLVVEKVARLTGYDPAHDGDRPVLKHEGLQYGYRVRLLDDTDELSEGEEGWLVLLDVGSLQHGTQRVMAGVLPDGSDSPLEAPLEALETV